MKPNIRENSLKRKKIIEQNYIFLENPFFNEYPLVSIQLINKNGINSLKRLFKNFEKDIVYPNYEIIVVDNNSNDKSIDFLEKKGKDLPLKIIKNNNYKTFSEANNQATKIAKGDYLLLLHNNIEPSYGWLNEMMGVMLNNDNVGSVGAKLVYPNINNNDKNKSLNVQHAGIAFKSEGMNFHPFIVGNGLKPFDPSIKTETVLGTTASTLLIKKSVYEELGGLDERYVYEYADIDLALKLIEDEHKNYLCSSALLFNHDSPIQKKDMEEDVLKRMNYDFELLNRKWGTYLLEKTFKDKLNSKHFFVKDSLRIGLVVTETGDESRAGDFFTALELAEEFKKIGYEVTFINRKDKIIDGHIDVLINFLHKFNISSLKLEENTVKIAWMRNWFDKWLKNWNINDYDIYFASSQTACDYVTKHLGKKVFLLPIATNPYKFQIKNPVKKYESDYCFTGSYWKYPREIIELLDPDSLDYTFSIYGENWDKIKKFRPYNKGFIKYKDIPKIYASTKLVIDDANHATKKYGSVNSRVFDAIASGTLVITNGIIGGNETFNGKLPCFTSKSELNNLIKFYLENEKERIDKINELKDFVLKYHTYEKRALTIKNTIEKEF
ncbi:MAG: glycosyltransferase [Methanobrevibacter sp.]|nr:glycosyltransferase [Methanobrevibacter sp.]